MWYRGFFSTIRCSICIVGFSFLLMSVVEVASFPLMSVVKGVSFLPMGWLIRGIFL